MAAPFSQVFSPRSLADLFAAWDRFPDAIPFAGGTNLLRGQGQRILSLPKNILSLAKIEELRKISRTERFLDLGSMATLTSVLALDKNLPAPLTAAIHQIANPQIRNMATIGGNICCPERRMDCFAVLTAMDAMLELRTAEANRWISVGRFGSVIGPPQLHRNELLSRIRIPLESWDLSLQVKIGPLRRPDEAGAAFSFLVRLSKEVVNDIRLVLAGKQLVRDREIDNSVAGKNWPFSRKERVAFIDKWRIKLQGSPFPPERLKQSFFCLIEEALNLPILG